MEKSQPLEEQFNAVEQVMSSAGRENILYIGAYPSELNHFTKELTEGTQAIFIDFYPEYYGKSVNDLNDPTLICGSLEDISFLNAMAAKFAEKFSFITPDYGVTYYLYELEANHFKAIVKMLKPNGKFAFNCGCGFLFTVQSGIDCISEAKTFYDCSLSKFKRLQKFEVVKTRIVEKRIWGCPR